MVVNMCCFWLSSLLVVFVRKLLATELLISRSIIHDNSFRQPCHIAKFCFLRLQLAELCFAISPQEPQMVVLSGLSRAEVPLALSHFLY